VGVESGCLTCGKSDIIVAINQIVITFFIVILLVRRVKLKFPSGLWEKF